MQRSSSLLIVSIGVLLGGCARSSPVVFVDLDQVLLQSNPPKVGVPVAPSPPEPRPAISATVMGSRALALADPANTPRQSVQEMFRAGQTAALDQLLARLKEINKGIVNDFAIKQNTSITDDKAKAYLEANEKIRKLFEAWADERAPVFSKLTMVTGFPDPGPSTKESDPAQKPSPLDQTALANQLRTKLSSIDLQFKQKSDALLEGVVQQTHAAQAELIKQIEQKRIELETKAEMEAKAQIRRAVSKLQFRLADSAPVILPETPARHVTIPAEKALEAPPQVPSSGILEEKADRKRLLEHELRIWLALNRYTLSESRTGHRDATQEFQIWRQQHGAGP